MLTKIFVGIYLEKFALQVQRLLLSKLPLGQDPVQVEPNATRPSEQLVQVLELLQVVQEACNVEQAKKVIH